MRLQLIGESVKQQFEANKRVLSFADYVALVEQHPRYHLRNAAQYLLDMFDHYGKSEVAHPRGTIRQFGLFGAPWDGGNQRLIGQEEVQNSIYRILKNFSRQGKVDRFILLHGPNGSSKSTIAEMIARGMEQYSATDDGIAYRFNWVFPTERALRSGIGFGSDGKSSGSGEASYSYLDEAAIDARLFCELRDHPLLLIPKEERAKFFDGLCASSSDLSSREFVIPDYLVKGDLCNKCKLIFEALLNAYRGDYLKVLRHIQVERFYFSRRYRNGVARVEPKLAVDARTRQITADRSLASLPPSLQNIALYEADGELIKANRGVIDFADMLNRPIEAYKYLLTAVEDGRVSLEQANLFVDVIFIGSTNEGVLNAFMESHEWMSFKARIELVRVPYLLDYRKERSIYDEQIQSRQVQKHVSPYATSVAAMWSVLTRLRKPDLSHYPNDVKELVAKLSPIDKAMLYSKGEVPAGMKQDAAKTLRSHIGDVFGETDSQLFFEGRTGASPREIRTLILNAGQDPHYACLSPEAVLNQIGLLVQEKSVYEYLRQEADSGYYDHKAFIDVTRQWYLTETDELFRRVTGLVDESSYAELFSRYVTHAIHFVRKEQLRNPVTGKFENPDAKMMADVEKNFGISSQVELFRQELIAKIGAWSIDHPGEKTEYSLIFPEYFQQLRQTYYDQQRRKVRKVFHDVLRVLSDEEVNLSAEDRQVVDDMLTRLRRDHHYCNDCVREAMSLLMRTRYS